jgi:surface protein
VSNVTDMKAMFSGAGSFDQTLIPWSFKSDVRLEEFLSYSGFSQENYESLLQSFESQNLFNINLGADLIGYCDEQARESLINEKGWTIEGDIFALCDETLNSSTSPFVTTWTVSSGDLNIILNIPGFYDYNFSINWGDGQGNTGVTQTISHNYSTPGTYTVEIIGVYPYFSLCESPSELCDNARKLSTVESWGNQKWQLMHSSFKAARNFTMPATDIPDLSQVTNMSYMFSSAETFNQPLNNWDVSGVTDINNMFYGAESFNQPLSNWDVSSVTDMSSMFNFAESFNQPLNNWDVSNVTDMSFMFYYAESFNQPLNNWDVSSVINMGGMFQVASSYNQPLSNWDVSSVTIMNIMFNNAVSFNQDISTWCVDQIPTEPGGFSSNSPLQDSFKPIWGTCEPLSTNQVQAIELTLFPNPVSEKLFVDFQSSYNFQSIKIFDMLGREVKALNPDRIQEGIEVSGMNTGSYLLQFMTQDKQQLTKRFIVK